MIKTAAMIFLIIGGVEFIVFVGAVLAITYFCIKSYLYQRGWLE